MFEVGLTELAVIALVALLVLGPERLPRAARTAGLYVRKARATWHSIRADIERELAAEDMKKAVQDTERSLTKVAAETRAEIVDTAAASNPDTAAPDSKPNA